jgi:hypothetical protein
LPKQRLPDRFLRADFGKLSESRPTNTRVTWKAEYLYMDLGTENFTFNNPLLGTILVNTHFTDNIVRVGLNYQFH